MNLSSDIKISVLTPSIRPEGLKYNQESLERQTFKDFEWLVELGIPGRGHDLNAAYNRMLRRAKGELIVSMQDYMKAPPDWLEKWWKAYQENPGTFMTAPHGKTLDWVNIEWDWRAYEDANKPSYDCWEIDNAAAPLEALKSIGGFDEELDRYWSSDNVNVAYRAYLNGFQFKNIFNNPVVSLNHDKIIPHPFREKYNPKFNRERMDTFKPGEKLNYI